MISSFKGNSVSDLLSQEKEKQTTTTKIQSVYLYRTNNKLMRCDKKNVSDVVQIQFSFF